MPRDNLTDGGGTGTRPSSDDETDSTTDDTQASTTDVPDDIQDDGGDTATTEPDDGGGSEPPDDLQDSGPGPGDSPTGGGDVDDGTDETVDDGSTSEPPSDLQDSGPGPGDSSENGSTDDGDTSQPDDPEPASEPERPPDDLQNEGPASTEPDEPDYRAGPGRSQGTSGDESESTPTQDSADDTQGGDDGIVSLAEQYYVQARDYLDGEDVRVDFEDGEGNLELTASGVAATFAAEREGVDESDVTATQSEDGGWQIEYTDEAREEQLRENYDPGPSGAGEQISGEAGISDEGSPEDPLEGTALEAGLGETADAARDLEDRVTDDAGTAGGRQDPGEGLEITDDDVEVVIADDGTMRLQRARGQLTAEQAQNIDDAPESAPVTPTRQSTDGLQQETTSGVTPDYTTAAVNRVEDQIEQQLEEQGVDPENVDINVSETDDGYQADIERTGETEERFGDIDWSFGMGDPREDEVEQFIDERVGEQGSEWVGENVSQPLREFGEGAKESNLFINEDNVPDTVGAGQATGNLAIAAANVVEEAPRLPGTVLEGVEGANYLLEATPVAGGSEEEFDERAGEAAAFAATVGQAEAERARTNPGTYAGELLLGFGVGKAVSATRFSPGNALDTSAARRGVGEYTPDTALSRLSREIERTEVETRMGAGLGSLKITRDGPDSDTVGSDDLDVDPAQNFDMAEERRQFLTSKAQRELEQRQEYLDRVPGDPEGDAPVGEYTATRRSGGSLSEQEYRTVSEGSDTSRSGPTQTQREAFSSVSGRDTTVKMGPGERIKARQLNPPTDDLRRLDALERDLLDGPKSGNLGTEIGGGLAEAGGVTLSQLQAGEGVSGTTIPATFGTKASAGTWLGLGLSPDTDTGSATVEDATQPPWNDVREDSDEGVGIGPDEDTNVDVTEDVTQITGQDITQTTDQDVGITPDSDLTPGFDSGGDTPAQNQDSDPSFFRSPDPDPDRPSPRFPNGEDDEDNGFGFGSGSVDSKVFDTGVVQSIEEATGADSDDT